MVFNEVSLEEFAEVSAHLLHFSEQERRDVLARFAVSPERWELAETAFRDRLAAEAAKERSALLASYARAFVATRRRLEAEQPKLASLGGQVSAIDAPPRPELPHSSEPIASGAPNLDMTLEAQNQYVPAAVLPFRPGPSTGIEAQPTAHRLPIPRSNDPIDPDGADRTAEVDLALVAPATPFDAAGPVQTNSTTETAPGEPPTFTLEQYASYCVELSAFPDAAPRVRARYRLFTPRSVEIAEQTWSARLAGDSTIRRQFEELVARYRDYFAGTRI